MITPSQEPFPPADLVIRALEALAERCESMAAGLEAQPQYDLTRDERAMPQQLRCEAARLRSAIEYYASGYRPIIMADGSYLIASRSGSGALFHTIRKVGGRWVCSDSCPQHRKGAHVHQALMLGIERALEMVDEEDDGDAAAQLGRRIAAAVASGLVTVSVTAA